MEATCALAALVSTFLETVFNSSTRTSTAFWIPFFKTMGLAPAATLRIPSRIIA